MKKFIRIVALVLIALFIVGCSQKEAEKKTEINKMLREWSWK